MIIGKMTHDLFFKQYMFQVNQQVYPALHGIFGMTKTSLARVHPPACTFVNIRGQLVKIPTIITVIIYQTWLDIVCYIVRVVVKAFKEAITI